MIPKLISVGKRLSLRAYHTEKFKAETLSLSVVLPIERDTAYLTSLLFSVLLRGTERYPTVAALNRRLDYLYGAELSVRNFYRGDCRILGLSANVLGEAYLDEEGSSLLVGVMEVMREIFFSPALDENGLLQSHYVESEKQLQCDTIRAQKNHPGAYAADRCRSLMHENEPVGIPIYGTVEEVMAVTPERLTAHWKALLQTLSLNLFYVGAGDEKTLIDAARSVFLPALEVLEGRIADAAPISKDEPTVKTNPLYAEEKLPIKQGHLAIGIRTGRTLLHEDFYACTLLNELLGASPVSKLFVNVRERLSLCYSCSSIYNIYKGTLMILCGLEDANRALAEQEIFAQIRAIQNGDFTDAEWSSAKKSVENAYRQLSDSPAALESYYFGRALCGLDGEIEFARRCFDGVTREDVVRVANALVIDTVFYLGTTGEGEDLIDEED